MLLQSPLDKKIDNSVKPWVPSANISISAPWRLFKMVLKHLRVIRANSSHSEFPSRKSIRKNAPPYSHYLNQELIIQVINSDRNIFE